MESIRLANRFMRLDGCVWARSVEGSNRQAYFSNLFLLLYNAKSVRDNPHGGDWGALSAVAESK
jgi:hypothetical protein